MKPRQLTEVAFSRLSRIESRGPGLDLARFPDFLVIGPQRSGTTWLHHHLFRHPSIFLPRKKEMYFFSRLGKESRNREFDDLEDYLGRAMKDSFRDRIRKNVRAWMQSGTPYRPVIRGESTATYAILDPAVIEEICVLNPDLKAIMMLRDPVDRAWSHARKDLFSDGVPDSDSFPMEEFEKFCRASGQTQLARYSEIIENWQTHLKPGNLFLGRFSDISDRPESILRAILRFLGVPAERRHMDRRSLVKRINPAPEVAIPPAALKYLRDQLRDMIDDYESILRDLEPLS